MAFQHSFRFRKVVLDEEFKKDAIAARRIIKDEHVLRDLVEHIKWYVERNAHNCVCKPGLNLYLYMPRRLRNLPQIAVYFIFTDNDEGIRLLQMDVEREEDA